MITNLKSNQIKLNQTKLNQNQTIVEPRTSSEDDIISVMMVTTTCHFNASTGRLATWDSTFLDLFQVILFLFIFLILLIVFDYITFILTMALFLFL